MTTTTWSAGREGPHGSTRTTVPELLTLPRPPLPRLWIVELRKLVDTRVGLVLIGVGALLAGCFGGGALLMRDQATFGEIAQLAGVPGATLAPVLAVCLVTAERTHRTALVTYALVPRRSRVLVAKIIAAATLAIIVVLLALLAALIITPVGSAITGVTVYWQVDWPAMGLFAAGSVLAALSGCALGLLLGNAPAAIVIILVWPMLESGLRQFPAPARALDWIDVAALSRWSDGITVVEVGQVISGIAVWVVIPGVIGWIRAVRGEVR